MQPNEESHSIPKLKVVPPNQIKPPTEPTPPIPTSPASPSPTNTITPSNDGRKSYHTWIMVGTIAAAVLGTTFIPWVPTVSASGTLEPKNISLISIPPNQVPKDWPNNTTSQFKEGQTIATTKDLQYEEKIREINQSISNVEAEKKSAQESYEFAKKQLQEAETTLQIALSRLNQSRSKLNNAPSIMVIEEEMAVKQAQLNGAENNLRDAVERQAQVQVLINTDPSQRFNKEVVAIYNEVRELTTRKNILIAEISQSSARENVEKDRLRDNSQEDYYRLTEKNAAVDSANQKVRQAEQEVNKVENSIKELRKRNQSLEVENKEQTNYVAPFDGVAEFKELQQPIIGQKLNKSSEIIYYDHRSMMFKAMISELEYTKYIKDNQNVVITFVGGKEVTGIVIPRGEQPERKIDSDPSKQMVAVWIAFDKPQVLERGISGKVVITIGQEGDRIYNVIGNEIYKLITPLQPFIDWLLGRK